MQFDLIVVGASFAGIACARAAALAGLRVCVIDRKPHAGAHVHTTGLLVREAAEIGWLRDMPAALTHAVPQVCVYAPSLRHVRLQAPGYHFLATDTPALLQWMEAQARQLGVVFCWGLPLRTLPRGVRGCTVNDALHARYLVGADGPHSKVARLTGLSINQQFLSGVELEFAGAELHDPQALHCLVDRQLAPGYIGWALQGVGMAQLGLARRHVPGQPPDAQALLRKLEPLVRQRSERPSGTRAGLIPCGGVLPKLFGPGVLLVGDAAGMVSPLTAGGIHQALACGAVAGEAVGHWLRGRGPQPDAWLARHYPSFGFKRWLRWGYEHLQSDHVTEWALGSRLVRAAMGRVYFHRRSLATAVQQAPERSPAFSVPRCSPPPTPGFRSRR